MLVSVSIETPSELDGAAQEEWRPFPPEFPGYIASCLGEAVTMRQRGRGSKTLRATPIPLKVRIEPRNGYGYVKVIDANGKSHDLRFNRVVARVFLGEPPTPEHDAAHLNGDRTDNRASNLAWKTPTENAYDKRLHGTHLYGVAVGTAKLDPDQVVEILTTEETGIALAKKFGINPCTISTVRVGDTWREVLVPDSALSERTKRVRERRALRLLREAH
jgi:hypothetical protein